MCCERDAIRYCYRLLALALADGFVSWVTNCGRTSSIIFMIYYRVQELLEWKEKIAGWGYDPVICSVRSRSGVAPVMEILREKTAVVVGPSGVGKSSLINALRDVSGIEMWREKEAMQRLETMAFEEDDDVIIPQVCPICVCKMP